jgi:hypothetical protein
MVWRRKCGVEGCGGIPCAYKYNKISGEVFFEEEEKASAKENKESIDTKRVPGVARPEYESNQIQSSFPFPVSNSDNN